MPFNNLSTLGKRAVIETWTPGGGAITEIAASCDDGAANIEGGYQGG